MSKPSLSPITPDDDPEHEYNFLLLIVYQCCLRIGWIFKTESIIMPAVLDVIGGSGWLRGCLPALNRFGQSIPPLLASDRIRGARIKRSIVVGCTTAMGLAFVSLSIVWMITGGRHPWLPIIFLVIYACFFTATGLNQLGFNTLTGKLVQTRRRGLLSLISTVVGASLAICFAVWLLYRWLSPDSISADTIKPDGSTPQASQFEWIFLFTGVAFIIGAIVVSRLRERPDIATRAPLSIKVLLKSSLQRLWEDRNFRLLAITAGLFGMSLTLFPHYQRLGRDRFALGMTALIPWLLAQNIGAATFSVPAGWVADRFGNRVVLRWSLLTMCVAPILAIVLAQYEQLGWFWFTVVFWLLGLTPVTIRFFNNYTLEITERENHPQYLSTLSLAMAIPPIVLSVPLGWLVEAISFEFVFLVVTGKILCGFVLTFFLIEPRHENGKDGKID